MPDTRINIFGGIRTDTPAKGLSAGEFIDGKNFYIDPFGSIKKRNGCNKINSTALGGSIWGISQLLKKNFKWALVINAGEFIWLDTWDDIDYAMPDAEDSEDTGCCNYSRLGECITDVTATECIEILEGNFWKKDGDCEHTSGEDTCLIVTTTSTSSSTTTFTETSSTDEPTTTTTTTEPPTTTSTSTSTTTTTTETSTTTTGTSSTTTTVCGTVNIESIQPWIYTNWYYLTGTGFCDTRGAGRIEVQLQGAGDWYEADSYDNWSDTGAGFWFNTIQEGLEAGDVVKLTNYSGSYDTIIWS